MSLSESTASVPSSFPRSVSPEIDDPVLGIVIPSESAKESIISSSHAEHLSAAIRCSESLTATLSPHLSLISCVDKIVALGPVSLSKCKVSWQSAGPFGSHPARLRCFLEKISYTDVEVVDDLLQGFPLIGDIPIDPAAPFKKVRSSSMNVEQLRAAGRLKVQALALKQLRKVGSEEFAAESAEVFEMTIADSLLNRMSAPIRRRKGFLKFATRRFAVRQMGRATSNFVV
jgi:hypothetical protein